MWSVPCVEAHPIMRSLRSKSVEPLLVLCDLCGSLLELVTAGRRRVKNDTCENNEKSDDKCLHDSLRLKIPSQSRKRFAICEGVLVNRSSVKSVNIIRRLRELQQTVVWQSYLRLCLTHNIGHLSKTILEEMCQRKLA